MMFCACYIVCFNHLEHYGNSMGSAVTVSAGFYGFSVYCCFVNTVINNKFLLWLFPSLLQLVITHALKVTCFALSLPVKI